MTRHRRHSPEAVGTPPGKDLEPRCLGEYVLLARLGEDILGTVSRAFRPGEKDRFVRFRILQSAELSPSAVATAVKKNGRLAATLAHRAIVPQSQLGTADGIPYLAWSEPTGWTLDAVLAKVRARGSRIPLKFALSIAERVAAGLEAAWLTVLDGQPTPHGLLWPGFVSIGGDTEVRVGGFGLAEAVLPSLRKPRLAREIAPYIAPEARGEAEPGSNSDVYSLGALIVELLTCRRPSLDSPFSNCTGADLPKEIEAFLSLSLAAPAQRFPSVIAMRRVLQEALAASRSVATPADLALYLYGLLNPESASAGFLNPESPHPVSAGEDSLPDAEELPETAETTKKPRPPFLTETHDSRETRSISIRPPKTSGGEDAPLERIRPPRRARRAAALLAIAAASAALLLRSRFLSAPLVWLGAKEPREVARATTSSGARSLPLQSPKAVSLAESEDTTASPPKENTQAATATRETADLSAKKAAEDSRFKAALARVETEQLEPGEAGKELLARGKNAEQQGERLLRQQRYRAAEQAFQKAANLFHQADSASHEERARRIELSTGR